MTPKHLAITGVGGFIGLRLLARARGLGIDVSGLEVSPLAAEKARARGATVVVGDVADDAAVRRAVEGADCVIHTAAVVSEGGPRALFERVNVLGTATVADEARRAGARRLVHFSSVMVHGFSYPDGVREDAPLRGGGNPYAETKIDAERVVSRYASDRLGVTIVRPGDVYGEGSVWVDRPVTLMKRGLFALPDGGSGLMNHVHVENLVDAVFLMIERDAAGPFHVTDGVRTDNATYFGALARTAGLPPPRTLPRALLGPAFTAIEKVSLGLGKEPPARAEALRYLLRPGTYAIEKAKAELGYVPRIGLDAGMRGLGPYVRAL